MSEWNQCFYCGRSLRFREITCDHVVPKIRGGDKFVTACAACNVEKADLDLEEFREMRGVNTFYGEQMGWQPW